MSDRAHSSLLLQRILREAGVPELVEILTNRLSPTDLQSLLLAVYRQRAASLTPRELVKQYASNRFVRPASAAPSDFLRFDELAYSLLPQGFETVELSPLAPLGSCAAVAPVDQNNVVTTIRNTEVVADSTNVLALECAARRGRSARRLGQTKLCSSHRLVRAQTFQGPVSFPHFRLLALCTAGRNQGSLAAELGAVMEHIDYFLRLLEAAVQLDLRVHGVRVSIALFSSARQTIVTKNVHEVLSPRFPEVDFAVSLASETATTYYENVRFQIHARAADQELLLVDGGLTPWTKLLLNDQKEFLVISGMGSERFIAAFREPPPHNPRSEGRPA